MDRRQVELILLEHPARPPFVHVAAGPGLIHRDAGSVKRHRVGIRDSDSGFARVRAVRRLRFDRLDRQPELLRGLLDSRASDVRDRDVRGTVERRARAVLQQPVDRDRRVRALVVELEPGAAAGDDVSRGDRGRAAASNSTCVIFEIGRQRIFHERRVDAEQHAERPRGDVVGRLGRRVRSAPDLGIGLLLEHVLRVAREDLRHRDDERAGRVCSAVGFERRVRRDGSRRPPGAGDRPGAPPRADRAASRPASGSPTDWPFLPSSIVWRFTS